MVNGPGTKFTNGNEVGAGGMIGTGAGVVAKTERMLPPAPLTDGLVN